MVKHTQTIRWLLPTNCLSVFDYFVGLALKELYINTNQLGISDLMTKKTSAGSKSSAVIGLLSSTKK